jgi:lipopolysaccharide export LptBFGC system permease protein LptF
MDPFRKRKKKHTPFHAVSSQRELFRLLVNVILCLAGLVFGFIYLVNGLIMGWLLVAVFTFFLLVQFSKPTDYDI